MLVWQNYRTDLGRAYPMFVLSARFRNSLPELSANSSFQLNDSNSNINPLDLLPESIVVQLIEVEHPCAVEGLTPRYLILWASDGGQFQLNYPQPFSQNLYEFLTLNTNVAAFEFVGERLKYGRLKRLLDNVRP